MGEGIIVHRYCSDVNHNLVGRQLKPLRECLGRSHAQLEKIMLGLTYDHNNLVTKKLNPLQARLDHNMMPSCLKCQAGYIEEKWALMMSEFTEEEGDQKLQALRSRGLRGLGVGLSRLKRWLAELKEALGSAPKASLWFRKMLCDTDATWASRLPQ
jgi:hypothetical protein